EVRPLGKHAGDAPDEVADAGFGRFVCGVLGHRVGDGPEDVEQDLAIERGLAAEVVVDHRLVQAGAGSDAVDLGAGEPAGGELGGGRGEETIAAGGRLPRLTNHLVNTVTRRAAPVKRDLPPQSSCCSRWCPDRLTGNRVPSVRIAIRLSFAYSSTRASR